MWPVGQVWKPGPTSPATVAAAPTGWGIRSPCLEGCGLGAMVSSVAGGADPGRGAERFSERFLSKGRRPDSNQCVRIRGLRDVACGPFKSSRRDVGVPRATVASFQLSAFSFPHYEEGEYSGSRGAAEHAERIQSSSLRALRASA